MATVSALGLGVLLSAAVALLARRRGSLTTGGAAAAVVVGAPIFAAGAGLFLGLLGFFVTSSALGRVGAARKAGLRRDYEKGDERDAGQVFANGGVAAACAAIQCAWPGVDLVPAIVGALATANADTWATELGPLSTRAPYSLRTLRAAPAGTSGAVSGLGLAASAAGGALVGGLVGLVAPGAWAGWLGLGAACGAAGSLVDSALGAGVQAGYRCPACARACEASPHACGAIAAHVRGLRWFGNDAVNLAATLAGALLGAGLG
ncbi:MAG: DUF92 domain-containing protein [Myxococcales bacterium]|nr:DUF92 domain-containing protein [Myxococcales bacterium]